MNGRATDWRGHEELVAIVRRVRRRWRLKVALRGAAAMLGAALVIFLISAFLLDRLAFSPVAVITARVILAVAALALLVGFLFLPLRRRVTDDQVALYLEEHEPTLRSSLISALTAGEPDSALSPALARRTIETALERCRAVEGGLRVERKPLRQSAGLLGGVTVAGILLFLLGPAFVQFGARAIFLPLRSAEAAPVFRILVQPGDTSLARGADLQVVAALAGFTSEQVDLVMRSSADSLVQRVPMLPSPGGAGYEVRLFDLNSATQYYVEAASVRSPAFRVEVLDLPYVDAIDLELRFPRYTGLETRVIEDGGDVAAPIGTVVQVRARATMPVEGARLVMGDGVTVELSADSAGGLVGEFTVRESGIYHIELDDGAAGTTVGSPQYLIDALDNVRPTVQISRPGRDMHVTLVDEVFLEATAQDDYGISTLELVYSVNGGPEQTVPLYQGGGLTEVSAGHTVYLEELDLEVGDFISYFARVSDAGVGAREPVSSDIYFLEMRPFGRNYRQAESGGGGGGGGGGDTDAQLSQRQRQLISATFNLIRDREEYSQQEFTQNMATLAEAQKTLQQQALTLAQRLANRGVGQDSALRTIVRALPQAAAEMADAADQLEAHRIEEALPPEQRALLHLQRAEAAFREVQVQMGQGGGGGGGADAQDLADLFGLELDKLQNQYETVQRGGQQSAANQAQMDEIAARVRELARRLERENERLREAMANQARNGNAAANQRALAQETEEEARRLERLSREQSRPDLAESARQLQEAADAMRRAAAESRTGNTGAGREALDRLRQAGRRLEQSQRDAAGGRAQQIASQARELAEEGRQIRQEMDRLPDAADRANEGRRLADRKEEQAEQVEQLQRRIEELSADARADQPDMSRRLQEASESVRRNRLPEAIRASRAATSPNAPREYVNQFEAQIVRALEELEQLTDQASRSFRPGEEEGGEASLDRARDLVRGLESMRERTRQSMGTQMSNREGGQEGPGGAPQAGGEQGGEEGGSEASGRLGGRPEGEQEGEQEGENGASGGGQSEGRAAGGGAPGTEGEGGAEGQAGEQGQGGAQGQAGSEGEGGAQGEAGGNGQGGQQSQGAPGGDGAGAQGGDRQSGQAGGRLGGGPGADGRGRVGLGWSNGAPAPGSPDAEAVRQLRAEARQRLADARELRQELAEQGLDTGELDAAISQLQRLDDPGSYAGWDELEHIQAAIVDRVKEFEFSLRQTIEGEQTRRRFLSGSGEVPPEYREAVERYYRELSEGAR